MAYKSSSRGGARIRLVALHTAEGARTAASLGAFFSQPSTMASSHVGIDAGHTLRYVSDDRAAWTLRSGNPISINAELCAFARWTRAQWLSTTTVDGCANPRAMIRRVAAWAKASCAKHNIPVRLLTPAQTGAGQAGIIDHYDWTIGARDGTHTDVGNGFPWDVFLADMGALPATEDGDDMGAREYAVLVENQRRISRVLAIVTENQQRLTAGFAATQQTLAQLVAAEQKELTAAQVEAAVTKSVNTALTASNRQIQQLMAQVDDDLEALTKEMS